MSETIGNIDATAPLWNGADFMTLKGIVQLLSNASYHYADDSRGEWGRASLAKMEAAAAIINQHKLRFYAIEALYKEAPQLFVLGDLINAVLKDARK